MSTTPAQERQRGSYEVIMQAARQLFHEKGADATSMQDVANATGLHKSTLYHYLKSKDELLEAVCREIFARLEASLEEVEARDDLSPRDKVLAALDAAADVALSDVSGTNVILSQREGTAVGARTQEWRRSYDERFAQLVRAAQEAGEVRDDIDAALLTRLVLGAVNWIVLWYRPGRGRASAESLRQAVTSIIDTGI